MSSELHKYIEKAITKKEVLLNGEVIKFPQDKNSNKQLNLELNKYVSWKLYDKSNSEEDGDQLRTVVGICLMFTALTLIGLYSSII